MSIIHGRRLSMEAEPRVPSAPTDAIDTLGQPETREDNNSTGERTHTRRKVLTRWLGGFTALALAGGTAGLYKMVTAESGPPEGENPSSAGVLAPPRTEITATPEQSHEVLPPRGDFETFPRVFKTELTRDQIKPPTTLSPNTFTEVFANVGMELQNAVNTNDQQAIDALIPGGDGGFNEQPEAFGYRAAYVDRYRKIYDTEADRANHNEDPENNSQNYAWGFTVEMIPDESGDVPHGNVNASDFVNAKVRITIGDYRPSFDGVNSARTILDTPRVLEANMYLTRETSIVTAKHRQDGGWMIADITNIELESGKGQASLEVPPIMRTSLPAGYTKVPAARIGG